MNRKKYRQEKKQSSRKRLALKISIFSVLTIVLVGAVYAGILQKKAVDAARHLSYIDLCDLRPRDIEDEELIFQLLAGINLTLFTNSLSVLFVSLF